MQFKRLGLMMVVCLGGVFMLGNSALAMRTSGGILLKQGVGARALGMGEAFVGIADDATCVYWNPAGLSRNRGIQATAAYFTGLVDSAYEQLAYTQGLESFGLENSGSVGLGLVFLQGGLITVDQPDGTEKRVQSESDWVVTLGYGVKLSEKLGAGLGVKVFNSTLAEEARATAVGLDVGLLLAATDNLSVGLAVQNAGTEIKYQDEGDPQPLTARLGAGYRVGLGNAQSFLLGADLVKANDHDLTVHTGAEYLYNRLIAVRLGYKAGYDLGGITAGFGVHASIFQLDYALEFVQELNLTHKVSLSLAL